MHFRLLTYNVHKCIGGLDRKYDPERICSVIAAHDPDIAFLQEVDANAERSNGDEQVKLLAKMLGYQHYEWAANVRLRKGGSYGNAILSRFPLRDWRNIDITMPPKKRRSILHAACRVRRESTRQVRTVHLLNGHLGLASYERRRQLNRLMTSLPVKSWHEHTPVIFAGDLNDVWGNVRKQLTERYSFASGAPIATFPAYAPVRALDGIFVRGNAKIDDCFVASSNHAKAASDHLALLADIELS